MIIVSKVPFIRLFSSDEFLFSNRYYGFKFKNINSICNISIRHNYFVHFVSLLIYFFIVENPSLEPSLVLTHGLSQITFGGGL